MREILPKNSLGYSDKEVYNISTQTHIKIEDLAWDVKW